MGPDIENITRKFEDIQQRIRIIQVGDCYFSHENDHLCCIIPLVAGLIENRSCSSLVDLDRYYFLTSFSFPFRPRQLILAGNTGKTFARRANNPYD